MAMLCRDVLTGKVLLKYVGSIGDGPCLVPLSDPLMTARVDQWLDYAEFFSQGYDLKDLCSRLNAYLSLRTFLVGFELSVADLSLWMQLKSRARS